MPSSVATEATDRFIGGNSFCCVAEQQNLRSSYGLIYVCGAIKVGITKTEGFHRDSMVVVSPVPALPATLGIAQALLV